jgi:hypothetical protein
MEKVGHYSSVVMVMRLWYSVVTVSMSVRQCAREREPIQR